MEQYKSISYVHLLLIERHWIWSVLLMLRTLNSKTFLMVGEPF